MAPIHSGLQKLLDQSDVDYEVIPHREDYQAEETARDTGTPPGEFAKTVLVRVDGRCAMAVLPASHRLAPSRLARDTGARDVELASEDDMRELLTDCEVGAAPPFGELFDVPVYVSPLLAADERITFNGGTHRDAVRIAWQDYERLAHPRIVSLSRHET